MKRRTATDATERDSKRHQVSGQMAVDAAVRKAARYHVAVDENRRKELPTQCHQVTNKWAYGWKRAALQ
eukprot:12407203-Karenia_brevis.AAC.1